MRFIHIPDGRAASLASKADASNAPAAAAAVSANPNERTILSDGSSGFAIPVTTKMYNVPSIYGSGDVVDVKGSSGMYSVKPVYSS